MYLTDLREENLKDVITKQEPKVFERVTGLNVGSGKYLKKMCELGVFHNVNIVIIQFFHLENLRTQV